MSLCLLDGCVECGFTGLPVRKELFGEWTLHFAEESEELQAQVVGLEEGLLQPSLAVSLTNHRGVEVERQVALDVVVYYACQVVIIRAQNCVPVLCFEYQVLLQGCLENLACLFMLSFNHEHGREEVVSFQGVPELV